MRPAPLLLLLVALTLSSAASSERGALPPQVRTFLAATFGPNAPPPEEVPYEQIKKHDSFEERRYPSWTWVCMDTVPGDKVLLDFLVVTHYLQGINVADERMGLTVPVITQRRSTLGASLCAPLPADFQIHPPAPSSPRLRLVRVPGAVVYVRTFGGMPKPKDFMQQAEILKSNLTEAGARVSAGVISASFSPPTQLKNRRNEIWIIKN